MSEESIVIVPKDAENLKLPDPALRREYIDIDNRVIYLEGEIGGDEDPLDRNSLGIAKMIIEYNRDDRGVANEKRKPIKIFINSIGGDALGTLILVNVIALSKTPVHTINLCQAASAAGYVLASGHKRFALPGTSVLIHSGSVYYGGDREKVDTARKHLDKLTKGLNDMLFERTGIDQKTFKAKAPKEWYLDAEECVKYGVVDKIVESIDEIL